MASSLPSGTVTFVFTDIEGSTQHLQELGDHYAELVRDHRAILRRTFGDHGGSEVDVQGDAFFFAFTRARDAIAGAVAAQRALRLHDWPQGARVHVRMGVHTGEPKVTEDGYLGLDVARAARISAAGNGGQILISETTRALLGNDLPEGVAVLDLGDHSLKDIQHEHIYEVAVDGEARPARPLKQQGPVKSAAERLSESIVTHVEQEILRSLGSGRRPPSPPSRD